jgi:hypothetical protein
MTDKRYTIAREYCGYDTPRWVARFCGDWIGQAPHRQGAQALAEEHDDLRKIEMTVGKIFTQGRVA